MKRWIAILAGALLIAVSVPTIPVPIAAAATPDLRVGVIDSELTWINFVQHGWYAERPTGAIEHLRKAGFDVVEMRDADLTNRDLLDGLDALLLPVNRVLTEDSELVLADWLRDGGSLVVAMIGARVLPNQGCRWNGTKHPRYTSNWQAYWNCGIDRDDGFTQWFRRLNSNIWEWGPLSEAYGMRLVNDPTSRQFSVVDEGASHPIVSETMAALGITSISLDRDPPAGAGAEYVSLFNDRTTPMLRFSIPPGTSSFEGFSMDQFDGYPAAQAGNYGLGRFVYFDFGILDFLPEVMLSIASQPNGSVTQGQVASELLQRSLRWVAEAGNDPVATVNTTTRTWGEVDAWNSSIYVRQYIEAAGTDAVHAVAHIEIIDPAGKTVFKESAPAIGLHPGQGPLRSNWGYDPGGLVSGEYRVELSVTWTYPDYDMIAKHQAIVTKGQGLSIPTSPVPTGPLPDRLSGGDRYATAAAISADTFGRGVPVVYVATGTDYPDALAAVPAAIKAGGPVLLTRKDSLPSATKVELARLDPKSIVVIGGTFAVSSTVQTQLGSYAPQVRRIAGSSRFATAAAVALDAFPAGADVVYVATGMNYPDALAGGPVAGLAPGPILLTTPDVLPSVTTTAIKTLDPVDIVIIGGELAVSTAVANELAELGGTVSRIYGDHRYSTATALSRSDFNAGVPVVYVATAMSFPDALAGGVAAGVSRGPVLLVNETGVPAATARELSRLKPSRIVVLGGPIAVPEHVRIELALFTAP